MWSKVDGYKSILFDTLVIRSGEKRDPQNSLILFCVGSCISHFSSWRTVWYFETSQVALKILHLSLVDCCALLFLDDFALLGGSNVMNNVAHRLGGMISLWRGWGRGCWVGVTPTDGERVSPLRSVQSSIGPDFMTPGPTLTPFSLGLTIGRGGHHRQAQ